MADPITAVLIPAVAAVVGAIVGAVARPWGQDYVNRKAEERAAKRAAADQRTARIDRVIEILSMSGREGPSTFSAEKGLRELPAAVAAVYDADLSASVGRMLATRQGAAERESARSDALSRAGTLLHEAEALRSSMSGK
jgi:hypothetical protein